MSRSHGPLRKAGEAIAVADDRLERATEGSELSPQALDDGIDDVAAAEALVPDVLQELVPRHDAAGVGVEERSRGGGVYLFADRAAATAYLEGPIVKGLRDNPALAGVEVRLFDVLDGPSVITRGLSPSGQTPGDTRAARAAV